MRRPSLLVTFLIATSIPFTVAAEALEVKIDSPQDGSKVGERPLIAGQVTDPDADVWVVVHPLGVSDYWVQPRVSVRSTGAWKVQTYVGHPGAEDSGKLFEVRAVARPRAKLKEGLVLDDWPEAAARSEVIELLRE